MVPARNIAVPTSSLPRLMTTIENTMRAKPANKPTAPVTAHLFLTLQISTNQRACFI
jgi:hypothetical protein